MERGSVGLLRVARVRGSGVPAFPSAAVVSGAASPLPHAPHSDADPGRHRGGDHPRRRFRVTSQEKDPGSDRDAVRPCRDPIGRRHRSDQRDAARWPGHRSGLVPARLAAYDAHLLADRGAVAGLSAAGRLPARVVVGRGVFPVHPPAHPDHNVPGPAASDSTHERPG